jgi:hypothetical protein
MPIDLEEEAGIGNRAYEHHYVTMAGKSFSQCSASGFDSCSTCFVWKIDDDALDDHGLAWRALQSQI